MRPGYGFQRSGCARWLAIFVEHGEEVGARHRRRAEARDVRGSDLTVDEPKIARPQVLRQPHERDFRRVGRAREHRLAKEYAADRDAVEPADELAVAPTLERMRPAEPVQSRIGRGHLVRDPGCVRVAARLRARRDDCPERVVDLELEAPFI